MKTKKVILFLVSLFIFSTALTAEVAKPITVKVNGLVCSFCAQGIKKRFSKFDSVKSVQVSLEKKTVVLEIKEGKSLNDKVIKDELEKSGYNVVRIER